MSKTSGIEQTPQESPPIETAPQESPLIAVNKSERLIKLILDELGFPMNNPQIAALEKLENGDWDGCKLLALNDPCDPYLACLSFLASAQRSPMIADSVLRDAARHAAEFASVKSRNRLAIGFRETLKD